MNTSGKAQSQASSGSTEPGAEMALLGHDLRAAMADVLGGLHLLEDHLTSREGHLQLERVRAVAESLGRMVCDGMMCACPAEGSDFGRLPNHGHVLMDVLRHVEQRWTDHVAAAGLKLTLDLAPDLPILVMMDRLLLERILSNLIDNAAKYADLGTITLRVSKRSGGELRFTVRDQGPGFTAAALRRVFEFRARPDGMTQPGSGMGLHSAKEMADRMGGRLMVHNVLPENGGGAPLGAEVSLVLPAGAWRSDDADRPPGALPDLTGKTVLIAEDTPTSRVVLTRMVEHLGATCQTAENGLAARDALANGSFDIALIDIEMPLKSGIDVISETRALPGRRGRIPILAVTAYVLGSHRQTIYRAGADGMIAKPVMSLAAFGEAIAALLSRSEADTLKEKSDDAIAPRPASPEHCANNAPRMEGTTSRPGRWSERPALRTIRAPRPARPDGVVQRVTAAPRPVPSTAVAPGTAPASRAEQGIDRERLDHLLELAGPTGRDELLSRLAIDLAASDRALTTAIADRDICGVRSATHVLISLSGAVGATRLQAAMEAMNAAAHRADWLSVDAGDTTTSQMLAVVRGQVDEAWQSLGTPYLAGL